MASALQHSPFTHGEDEQTLNIVDSAFVACCDVMAKSTLDLVSGLSEVGDETTASVCVVVSVVEGIAVV